RVLDRDRPAVLQLIARLRDRLSHVLALGSDELRRTWSRERDAIPSHGATHNVRFYLDTAAARTAHARVVVETTHAVETRCSAMRTPNWLLCVLVVACGPGDRQSTNCTGLCTALGYQACHDDGSFDPPVGCGPDQMCDPKYGCVVCPPDTLYCG